LKRILVIQTLALGDLIKTTPLLAGLKATHPGAEIDVLANETLERVVRGNPDVAGFIPFPYQALYESANLAENRAVVETLGRLCDWAACFDGAKAPYDLIVNPNYNDLAASLAWLAPGGPVLGGDLTRDGCLVLRGDWVVYYHMVITGPVPNSLHACDTLCLAAGVRPDRPGPRFHVTPADRQAAGALLESLGARPDEKPVALHVGASRPERCWPLESFVRLGRLIQDQGRRLVLTGTSGEMDQVKEVAGQLGPGALVAAGRTDLGGLAGLLGRCRALVSNDSGPIHLAAAIGLPTLSIHLGKASPTAAGPYLPGSLALAADLDCAPCFQPEECSHRRCRWAVGPEDALAGLEHLLGHPFVRPPGSEARFYRASAGQEGWLDWEALTLGATAHLAAAYRRAWLAALKPGRWMKPPGLSLPPAPEKEPFVSADALVSRALAEAENLAPLLQGRPDAAAFQQGAARLGRLAERMTGYCHHEPLLHPLALYLRGRLASLDDPDVRQLLTDQANLYRQVQTVVRLLAQGLAGPR